MKKKPSESETNQTLERFNFPAHNVTIEASSMEEAKQKLDAYLKSFNA